MARFLISAAHKSSGKTTISVGLCAALHARGVRVQAFKKGPDYIDPMWLEQASGRPCFNLDPYLSSEQQIQTQFARFGRLADVRLVEGNKGLYDGLALDGSNSNAALAHMLDLPVVLVLDARGMTRGIAPLILGYQAFDPGIRIVGVILNQLGGARHESKLRAVIEHYTDVRVLGAVAHDAQLAVLERHLGLMPNREHDDAARQVQRIGDRIGAQVDLDALLQVCTEPASAPLQIPPQPIPAAAMGEGAGLRIGVAQDKAFGFYYPDDAQAMRDLGVQVVPFDTLHDSHLPDVDGVFIGGGFPEEFMPELAGNVSMLASVRAAVEAGLPVYAECGGLMYLCRSLQWKGQTHAMVGALPADVVMHPRPVGRGYVQLQATPDAPWPVSPDGRVHGHEFHYSSLELVAPTSGAAHTSCPPGGPSRLGSGPAALHVAPTSGAAHTSCPPGLRYAYRVLRGHGIDGQHDGLVYRNVLANYAHLRSGAGSEWVKGFVKFVRRCSLATDPEGYLLNQADWSEDFARLRAWQEGLQLTDEHWQVIHFLRAYFEEHRVQAQVRAMIWHFEREWGADRGNNHYLHALFPMGGPQKQGNRLAGLLKTKGEH